MSPSRSDPDHKTGIIKLKRKHVPWLYAFLFVALIGATLGIIYWLAVTFIPEGSASWPN